VTVLVTEAWSPRRMSSIRRAVTVAVIGAPSLLSGRAAAAAQGSRTITEGKERGQAGSARRDAGAKDRPINDFFNRPSLCLPHRNMPGGERIPPEQAEQASRGQSSWLREGSGNVYGCRYEHANPHR